MTAKTLAEFRTAHGDPTTWTAADMETFEHLAETKDIVLPEPEPDPDADSDPAPTTRDCWFCSAPNPVTAARCGFCCHRTDDNPTANYTPTA